MNSQQQQHAHYHHQQMPMHVAYSHPPLLSQMQSQSSLAPNLGNLITGVSNLSSAGIAPISPGLTPVGVSPYSTTTGNRQRQQQRSGHQRHHDPSSVSPSLHSSGPLPPPPAYGASTTTPLVHFLNVPSGGFDDLGSPQGVSHGGSFPQSPQSLGAGASAWEVEDLAEVEAFLPQGGVVQGPNAATSPTHGAMAAGKKGPKKQQRVFTRPVVACAAKLADTNPPSNNNQTKGAGHDWEQVKPRRTEAQEQQHKKALEKQQREAEAQAQEDDGLEAVAPVVQEEGQSASSTEEEEAIQPGVPSCCPERRFGHVAVVRPSTKQMVLFGGRQTGVCYDDLWTADLATVDRNDASESAQEDEAAGASKSNSKPQQPTMQWTQIQKPEQQQAGSAASVWPGPRAGHTAVITKAEEVLMFGGGTEGDMFGELYSYDFETQCWTLLQDYCATTTHRNYDVQVRPRKGHTAIWDEQQGCMFVYGGLLSLDQPLRDSTVWRYERRSNTWSPMPTMTGEQPPDRTYHVAAFDESTSSMYVFGGRAIRETPSYPFLGDLFSYNTHSGVWTRIEASGPDAPPPRMCAASCFYAGRFYVSHGGHTRYLNDSYEFDPKRERWSRSTETPSPLTRPTVVVHDNTLTLFGGCDHELFVNDCHQLRLVAPSLFDLCAEWLNDGNLIPLQAGERSSSSISIGQSSAGNTWQEAVNGGIPPPLALGLPMSMPTPARSTTTASSSASSFHSSNHFHTSLGNTSLTESTGGSTTVLSVPSGPGQGPAFPQGPPMASFGRSHWGEGRGPPRMRNGSHHFPAPRPSVPVAASFTSSVAPQVAKVAVTSPAPAPPVSSIQPLPRNVLCKIQRLLKDQGVLPEAPIQPRTSHIPTQPFF